MGQSQSGTESAMKWLGKLAEKLYERLVVREKGWYPAISAAEHEHDLKASELVSEPTAAVDDPERCSLCDGTMVVPPPRRDNPDAAKQCFNCDRRRGYQQQQWEVESENVRY